uniref:Fe2OG dioxygenase domain-containing protein n=2 Tax=Dunaliella tertiolecta TaxID=3047 RepID=A0A7S3QLD7_DUNTE
MDALRRVRVCSSFIAMKPSWIVPPAQQRYTTVPHVETLDPSSQKQGDTKEGFYFGREISPESPEAKLPLHGPNQWPNEHLVPGYRASMEQYMRAMNELGHRLLRLLALGLGLPPDHFDRFFDRPMIFLRPLHYAPKVSAPSEGVFGAGAHSDYGMLTLLKTDDVPGLQIHTDATGWMDVPPKPECFIINLGDMLERWTNGMYKSTLHRVVNTTGKERYSLACFFEPNFDTIVECLPQCCSPERPPQFPPTTSGQHLLDKYASTHAGYANLKQ